MRLWLRSFYQRKPVRPHPLVALKAVAHKLARACSHMLREQVPFERHRAVAYPGVGLGARKGGPTSHS